MLFILFMLSLIDSFRFRMAYSIGVSTFEGFSGASWLNLAAYIPLMYFYFE